MHHRMPQTALLVLKDGRVFSGQAIGRIGRTQGEVVFNTCMTGYQEILTDPSYDRQIVTFTYPHIGNVGVNRADAESHRAWAAGLVVKELSPCTSNYRAEQSLDDYLKAQGVVGIADIDTRALVRHIRMEGAQMAILSSDPSDAKDLERVRREAKALGSMQGLNLVDDVTCKTAYDWNESLFDLDGNSPRVAPSPRFNVVAFDFGMKRNILRHLRSRGCKVTVVPADTPADRVLAMKPDGVFLSNGPGDPAVVRIAINTVRALIGKVPVFGICLGHQIIGLALGATTYKLKFGHHGGNHPVKDFTTRKVEISSQNHGFVVEEGGLPKGAIISHINLNDQTVEGLEWKEKRVFSVQYHPEAAPGPHDSHYLFDRFIEWMDNAQAH